MAFRGKVKIEDGPWNKAGSHWRWVYSFECKCGAPPGGGEVFMPRKNQDGSYNTKPSDEDVYLGVLEAIQRRHVCLLDRPKNPIILKPDGEPWAQA